MKMGFVGTGHMGGSLALAMKEGEGTLFLHNRTPDKARALAERIGTRAVVATLEQAVACDFVFVGVKPKDAAQLFADPVWQACDGVIVSMIAGLSLAALSLTFAGKPVVRILPNTPVAVGEGITLVSYGEKVSDRQRLAFEALMAPTGELALVADDKIDAASVLTGSAPAYLDYFVDALTQAGVALGLDEKESLSYVLAMCRGTIGLCRASDKTPLTLGKEVCSPGGSTIEGVRRLLDGGLYETVKAAAKATYDKNRRMTE